MLKVITLYLFLSQPRAKTLETCNCTRNVFCGSFIFPQIPLKILARMLAMFFFHFHKIRELLQHTQVVSKLLFGLLVTFSCCT